MRHPQRYLSLDFDRGSGEARAADGREVGPVPQVGHGAGDAPAVLAEELDAVEGGVVAAGADALELELGHVVLGPGADLGGAPVAPVGGEVEHCREDN